MGLCAAGQLLGLHAQQAIGIYREGHAHARCTGGHGRNAAQFKARQATAVLHQIALALHDVQRNGGLPVLVGGEVLRPRRGQGFVARDDALHQAAHGFQTERQRNDIQQQHVAVRVVAHQLVRLLRGTQGHDFIGVEVGERRTAKKCAHGLHDLRHARGAAHQHHALHIVRAQLGIAQGAAHGAQGALCQGGGGAGQVAALHRPLVRGAAQCHAEWGAVVVGQGFFAGACGQAQRRFVGRAVRHHAMAAAQRVGQGGVVVIATQGRIAPGGHHFKHPLRQAQDGDVERAAAQVVHGVHALGSVVQAVGDGGGRGFVDQAQHLQARQLGGVFGGLALGIVKVGGHGDDGAVNQSAQAVFGTLAQAGQNFCADFHGAFHPGSSGQGHHAGGGDKFVGQVRGFVRQVAHAAAHEAFGRGDGVARVQRARGCSVVADVARAVFQIAHHRGQQHAAFGVGQAARHTTLHGSHQGVRGAQVKADGQAPLVRGGGLTGFRNLQQRHGVRGSLGVWGGKGRRWTGAGRVRV